MPRMTFALLLAALGCLVAPRVPAQDLTVEDGYYWLQFDEAAGERLQEFIDLAQKLLGRPINYTVEDVANVRIFIIGPQRIKQDAFYQYFQSMLKAYDFIVTEYGPAGSNFLRLQRMTGGRTPGGGALIKLQAPVVPVEHLELYRNDPATLITTSFALRYIDSRTATASFSTLFDQTIEQVRQVENSNSLVVTAFGSHVWGFSQLLKLIDVPPHKPMPVIHKRVLRYAAVDEIQSVVNDLLSAARGIRPGQQVVAQQAAGQGTIFEVEPRIISEPRSNSLLITGDAEMVARIEEWLDVLDVEVEPRGNTHVYRLKNTNASSIAEVLTRVLDNERVAASQARAGSVPAGGQGGGGLEIQASAVPDIDSNSVIVTATERKYSEIVKIIRELDVRRPQVLIEAAIVETSKTLTDLFTAGVALADVDRYGFASNFGTPLGIAADGTVDVLGELLPVSPGGTMGVFSGGDIPIPVLVQAIQTDTSNRVLSRPYLMTNDNQEATISTQEETSYQTSTTTQTATNVTFQQVTAGISLTISPSISAGNYLRLRVKIEVSNFGNPPEGLPGAPPDKTIRTVETPVTLPDGHTVILGGLVNSNTIDSLSKTPILGDLPLIGWLFRSSNDQSRERYLYIFLTPHIIDTDFALLDEISEARKRDVERLGGSVADLAAALPRSGTPDTRILGANVEAVFEMPVISLPSSGPQPNGALPAAPAPPPAAPAGTVPGFDEIFGYPNGSGSGQR